LINHDARLRIHSFVKRTTAREFSALLSYYAANPELASADMFNFVEHDAELAVSSAELGMLRQQLAALQRQVDPVVILRSAWICPNVSAWPVVEEWLQDRHSLDGMATEVTLVTTLDEAVHLFEPYEIDLVRRRRGFDLLQTFRDAPSAAPISPETAASRPW
jgi:hypothetical protein